MTERLATTDDTEEIREVARASWESDYPDILSRETVDKGVEDWYGTDEVVSAIEDPLSIVPVAERDGGVVGFAHAVLDDDTGVVLRLYVHPGHRDSRVGTTLFEFVSEQLIDHDVDRIRAMVLAENHPGNSFYRGLGFEQIDEGETIIGGESYTENTYELSVPA